MLVEATRPAVALSPGGRPRKRKEPIEARRWRVEKRELAGLPTLPPWELVEYRARMGLTRTELARRLGVTRRAVYRWESGDASIARPVQLALLWIEHEMGLEAAELTEAREALHEIAVAREANPWLAMWGWLKKGVDTACGMVLKGVDSNGEQAMQYAASDLSLTAGHDYNTSSRYEFCLQAKVSDDDEWKVIAREGGFKTNAQAKRAGFKAAQPFLAPGLF